jgi:hypothetical protein
MGHTPPRQGNTLAAFVYLVEGGTRHSIPTTICETPADGGGCAWQTGVLR